MSKSVVNAKPEQIFRSENAKKLYAQMSNRIHISQCGLDSKGQIYFHWLNGNTDRYSRKEFLRMSNQ